MRHEIFVSAQESFTSEPLLVASCLCGREWDLDTSSASLTRVQGIAAEHLADSEPSDG